MARAGVWYTGNMTVEDCAVEAPKNFRRCNGLTLRNVSFANAAETLWSCDNVAMERITVKGDYFAMNSSNMTVTDLTLPPHSTPTLPLAASGREGVFGSNICAAMTAFAALWICL